MMNKIKKAFKDVLDKDGLVVVLSGAGISAESGIPTFRGPEGYWTIGSTEYRPEEMATCRMFSKNPAQVWQWYLYRIGICRAASPNPGHMAVVEMEKLLNDRFILITQNVDGLHLRAGNSPARTFQIHGNIETVRCEAECTNKTHPIPESVTVKKKNELLSKTDTEALKCPECASNLRPHVLWFDECYNEEFYHFSSSLSAASKADLLITVGTSGATNLPMQVGMTVAKRGGVIVDVNPDANPFSDIARRTGGFFCQGPAGTILPELASFLK